MMIPEKLYEARSVARKILGDEYKTRMDTYSAGIKVLMLGESQDALLASAIQLTSKCEDPLEALFVMAAALEIMEPLK